MSLKFQINYANTRMLNLMWYDNVPVSDYYCLGVTNNKVKCTKRFTRQETMMRLVEICGPKKKLSVAPFTNMV